MTNPTPKPEKDSFRKVYAPLNNTQREKVDYLKNIGETVFDIVDTHTTGDTDRRLVDSAKNYIEIAIMLAVKVVTGP